MRRRCKAGFAGGVDMAESGATEPGSGGLVFDAVSFRYGPRQEPILDGVYNPTIGLTTKGIPARELIGQLPSVMDHGGRTLRPGEGLAGLGAAVDLHYTDDVGTAQTDDTAVPIVGSFSATGALGSLSESIVYRPLRGAPSEDVRYLYALASDATAVPILQRDVQSVLLAARPSAVKIDSPQAALSLREALAGHLTKGAAQQAVTILAAGLLLITMVTFAAISAKRRDIGRRRALGATRTDIIVSFLIQMGFITLVGIGVGTGVGLAALAAMAGALPAPAFTLAVTVLVFLTTLLGAALPAIIASRTDPVRTLRVP